MTGVLHITSLEAAATCDTYVHHNRHKNCGPPPFLQVTLGSRLFVHNIAGCIYSSIIYGSMLPGSMPNMGIFLGYYHVDHFFKPSQQLREERAAGSIRLPVGIHFHFPAGKLTQKQLPFTMLSPLSEDSRRLRLGLYAAQPPDRRRLLVLPPQHTILHTGDTVSCRRQVSGSGIRIVRVPLWGIQYRVYIGLKLADESCPTGSNYDMKPD